MAAAADANRGAITGSPRHRLYILLRSRDWGILKNSVTRTLVYD